MRLLFLILALIPVVGCTAKKESSSQKINLNTYCEPPSLDPRKATDSTSANILISLFEGLTRIGFDHKPHPACAEEIQVSEDKLTYTFHLRPLSWSNGEPLTAHDFVYSWQSTLDPLFPSTCAYKLFVIKNAALIKEGKLKPEALGVHAIDDKTLVVTLEHPTAYFLELLAFHTFYPVPRFLSETNEEWAADAKTFISNGPFKLDLWEHESELNLVKNPLYWDVDHVKLDTINMVMIDNTLTEYQLFETNDLDWAGSPLSNLPAEIIPTLKEQKILNSYPVSGVYYYKINTERPLLSNINIRKALSYAIDRKAIVTHLLQGEEKVATALIPPMPTWKESFSYFNDNNQEKAKELFAKGLEELQVDRSAFSSLVVSYNNNREHQKIAEAIQHQWKEVLGIEVTLEHFEWKVYLSKIDKQDFDIGRMGWVGDFNDPLSFLEPFKFDDNHIGGAGNNTGWTSHEYTSLLNASDKETNEKKRGQLLAQAEEILLNDMPIIPLYFLSYKYIKKPHVKNVYLSPLGVADFKQASIEEERR